MGETPHGETGLERSTLFGDVHGRDMSFVVRYCSLDFQCPFLRLVVTGLSSEDKLNCFCGCLRRMCLGVENWRYFSHEERLSKPAVGHSRCRSYWDADEPVIVCHECLKFSAVKSVACRLWLDLPFLFPLALRCDQEVSVSSELRNHPRRSSVRDPFQCEVSLSLVMSLTRRPLFRYGWGRRLGAIRPLAPVLSEGCERHITLVDLPCFGFVWWLAHGLALRDGPPSLGRPRSTVAHCAFQRGLGLETE
ncbi:hypothetical protein Tco_0153595 [Tanacetum coccineum]